MAPHNQVKNGASTPPNANESTPLLGSVSGDRQAAPKGDHLSASGAPEIIHEDSSARNTDEDQKSFPHLQILALCFVSLGEALAFFSIFPYVNEMVHRVGGVAETDVGFWSGLIESLFSLVQMVLMIFYGRAADRLGRKPVLVFSLAGVSAAVALFGLSRNLWQMILFRCVAGLFGGSVVTIRCMISENCDQDGQKRAFSWYMFTRQLSILFGPIIGGGLARPADQFPSIFGESQFFIDYPYALPSLVTASFCLIATAVSLFCLNETLQRKPDADGHKRNPMSTWEVIKAPGMGVSLLVFAHAMLLGLAFTATTPVSLYTSIENGGFSFHERTIAIYFTLVGASQAAWMLYAFAPVERWLGTRRLLRVCGYVWPLLTLNFPLMNLFRRNGWDVAFWSVAPVLSVLGSGVSMAFTCVQLAINNTSPSPEVLATSNALALTLNSAVRAVAPVVVTSLYAAGVKWGGLNGQLGWIVLTVVAAAFGITCRLLPPSVDGHSTVPDDSEGES